MNCPRCNLSVDEHPANRCMDAWVAEAVMGYRLIDGIWYYPPYRHGMMADDVGPVWRYSTSIADAWVVVEKFRRGHGGKAAACVMCLTSDEADEDSYCRIFGVDREDVQGQATQMPLAISRAALKAVGK